MNPQNSTTPSAPADTTGSGGGVTDTGSMFTDTKNKLAQTTREAAGKVKAAASNTASKVKAQAEQAAQQGKETAAARIGDYSSAIHESARSLEEKDPNIAWFSHRAADKLQNVADYIRQNDWSRLRGDCEGIARRHPAAFFGGLFLAGLVVGNVIKASQSRIQDRDDDQLGYGPESDWTGSTGEIQRTEAEIPTAAPTPSM